MRNEKQNDQIPIHNDQLGYSSNERSQKSPHSNLNTRENQKLASANLDISSIYESVKPPVIDYAETSVRSKESQRERSNISRGFIQESQYEKDKNPIIEVNDVDDERISEIEDEQIGGQEEED